jgi:hypothetical protein
VLPGGWRLRGWIEPHSAREARARARVFADRLREFERESPAVSSDAVVFLGSSTIERFPLAECFPGLACVDRGVPFARARELAACVERILPRDARWIVLYAGGADRVAAPLDVEGVADAAGDLCAAVRRAAPEAQVLLLGLLPGVGTRGAEARALERIDAELAHSARAWRFDHVRLALPPLTDAEGGLRPELSTDGLHLTSEGYTLLAERIRAAPGPVAARLRGATGGRAGG